MTLKTAKLSKKLKNIEKSPQHLPTIVLCKRTCRTKLYNHRCSNLIIRFKHDTQKLVSQVIRPHKRELKS